MILECSINKQKKIMKKKIFKNNQHLQPSAALKSQSSQLTTSFDFMFVVCLCMCFHKTFILNNYIGQLRDRGIESATNCVMIVFRMNVEELKWHNHLMHVVHHPSSYKNSSGVSFLLFENFWLRPRPTRRNLNI